MSSFFLMFLYFLQFFGALRVPPGGPRGGQGVPSERKGEAQEAPRGGSGSIFGSKLEENGFPEGPKHEFGNADVF